MSIAEKEYIGGLREKALIGVMWIIAHDDIGIWPQSISGGPHAYEKRSPWQEGWNACARAHTSKMRIMAEWLQTLGDHRPAIEDLLLEERLRLTIDEEKVRLVVDCSDTFLWGCADAEEINLDEIQQLVQCYGESPDFGGELWVARKRSMRPQTASYRECYPPSEWHLFDAAGPERDDPDGAGRDKLKPEDQQAWREQHGR